MNTFTLLPQSNAQHSQTLFIKNVWLFFYSFVALKYFVHSQTKKMFLQGPMYIKLGEIRNCLVIFEKKTGLFYNMQVIPCSCAEVQNGRLHLNCLHHKYKCFVVFLRSFLICHILHWYQIMSTVLHKCLEKDHCKSIQLVLSSTQSRV